MKWCRLVTARYRHRGVRLGEARNPGPPKRLRRVLNRRPEAQVPTPRTGLRCYRQTMTNLWSLPQYQARLKRTGDSFQLSSVSPTVPASSGTVHRALEGAEQAIQARSESRNTPAVNRGAPLPATERDQDTEEIPHHVIGTPRDSESEDLSVLVGSVGTVSLEGKRRSRANPFEIDDGRSDVGSAVSEDRMQMRRRKRSRKSGKW